MISEREFLRKLAKAKTEDDKNWLTTKRLIDSLSGDLQTLVYSAAIPHWFDAKILRALNPELSRRIRGLYSKLQELPFVEPFEGRGHNIHELTRRLILDYLWKKERHTYLLLSRNLVAFYEDSMSLAQKKISPKIKELGKKKFTKKSTREFQQWVKKNPEIVNTVGSNYQIEYIYHLAIVESKKGADKIQDLGWKWHDKRDYRYSELSALVTALSEHVKAKRIKGRALGWEEFFRGLLYFYRYDYLNAKMLFIDVINGNYSDKKLNADSCFRLGKLHERLSELPEARVRYEEALPLYRAVRNENGEAHCFHSLGNVHLNLSELPEAQARYEEALTLYRAVGNKNGEANSIRSLGDVYLRLSELSEARARFEEALSLYHAFGDKLGEAYSINSLGDVHLSLSELPEARARFEEALSLYRAVRDKLGEANCIHSLGDVHLRLSELSEARARFEEALSLYRALGDKFGEANSIRSLGDVHLSLSELPEAQARYEEALSLYRAVRDKLGEANCIHSLGDVHLRLSELPEARARFGEALSLYHAFGDKLGEANCIHSLGEVHLRQSELPEARARFEEALSLYRAVGNKLGEADSLRSLGDMFRRISQLPGEHTSYEDAETAYRKAIELNPSDATTYSALGILLDDLKRYDEAEAIYRKAVELNPAEVEAHYQLGRHLADENVKKYDDAEKIFLKILEIDSNHSLTLYCMSCIKSLYRDSESAFLYLQSAIANGFDRKWAWNDSDLEWIKSDPRFTEIVGTKPE